MPVTSPNRESVNPNLPFSDSLSTTGKPTHHGRHGLARRRTVLYLQRGHRKQGARWPPSGASRSSGRARSCGSSQRGRRLPGQACRFSGQRRRLPACSAWASSSAHCRRRLRPLWCCLEGESVSKSIFFGPRTIEVSGVRGEGGSWDRVSATRWQRHCCSRNVGRQRVRRKLVKGVETYPQGERTGSSRPSLLVREEAGRKRGSRGCIRTSCPCS